MVGMLKLCSVALLLSLSTSMGSGAEPPALQLEEPLDYQVFQRSNTGHGSIRIAGKLAGSAAAAYVVQVRLDEGEWGSLAQLAPGAIAFEGALDVLAGGWFRVELQVLAAGEVIGAGSVAHVGVGEVFVIAGQSNSANDGAEKQRVHGGMVANFDGERWRLADDPQPGASGGGGSFIPPFGDAMAERLGVPIGIIATGVGATSVREWLPAGATFPHPPTIENKVRKLPSGEWESLGGTFANFVSRARALARPASVQFYGTRGSRMPSSAIPRAPCPAHFISGTSRMWSKRRRAS